MLGDIPYVVPQNVSFFHDDDDDEMDRSAANVSLKNSVRSIACLLVSSSKQALRSVMRE